MSKQTIYGTITWTQHMKSIEPQMKKLMRIVDRLILMADANKQGTNKYHDLRSNAIAICESIGENFEDFAEYYSI